MSILVFLERAGNAVKTSSFEAVCYAAAIAQKTGDEVVAVLLGTIDPSELQKAGRYGAKRILHVQDERLNQGVIQAYASVLAQAIEKEGALVLVLAKSSLGDAIAARVAIKTDAALASNVVSLPDMSNGFIVKRSIYTGKAFALVDIKSEKKILAIKKSTIGLSEKSQEAVIESFEAILEETDFSATITSTEKAEGDVLLPEAEIVVSGGRGMKGPENWSLIEDLAKVLGAATGCSKPVSDAGWRPHHEHVGQTGVKVSPNLYIAVGISGAIQHLAGVSGSKTIVVINKDPDAPFFKAADYGIAGDAFDVLPKLTAAIEALK